ncbi:unnamed protein product, partial [Mesorhabditis belari]|uniref:Uncharacterized protein n=1 Tax=Mesorhabditis belari TaxID=2138241 RepID=A0AAF3J217_9BILA
MTQQQRLRRLAHRLGRARIWMWREPARRSVSAGAEKRSSLHPPKPQEIPFMAEEEINDNSMKGARPGFESTPLRTSSRRSVRSQMAAEVALRYDSVHSVLVDFCNRTSSHGIPFFGSSSFWPRPIWVSIFIFCTIFFLIQTYFTIDEFYGYRTIFQLNLKFEPAPFPAATVCNLNPYKFSELKKFPEIANAIAKWENALTEKPDLSLRILEATGKRKKRQAEFQPIFVRCTCNNPNDRCVPNRNEEANTQVCLCFEDVSTGYIWPCYPTTEWTVKTCNQCSFSNTCADPDRPNATMPFNQNVSCLCQGISHNCVIHPKNEIRWWNPNNYTIYPAEPPSAETPFSENLDLEGVFDKGTMTTRIKESVSYMVSELPQEIKHNLSYTLGEFVLRCTFDGKDCNMTELFQVHRDADYGNCYTFNFNTSLEVKSNRAGPLYGLRLLLNVNQEDYLPITEAAGVRLVVHERDQEPFPDTFGYSAPTGFVSSFGLKTKLYTRLPHPHGQCSDKERPKPYIYGDHYSPEGCYRNCFQMEMINDCGCGDPRLPLPDEQTKACNLHNATQKACLKKNNEAAGGVYRTKKACICKQQCTEYLFETSYSAAAWPSVNFVIGQGCQGAQEIFNDSTACTEYYRVNTAFLEIFYEQLNYETLEETQGYTMTNLFADFGGSIGLWIGFSVITVFEFLELIFELAYYGFVVVPRRIHKTLLEKKQRKKRHGLSIPQLLYKHMPSHSGTKMFPKKSSKEATKSKSEEAAVLSNDTSMATLPPDGKEIDEWPP